MKLHEMAKLIRTKNAGPFMLTIDILFETKEDYDRALLSKKLTRALIAEQYNISEDIVEYYECPLAYAIKFSFPRPNFVGAFEDTDIFGGQYHGPLVNIEID